MKLLQLITLATTLLAAVLNSGCDRGSEFSTTERRKGELTRELATEILNEHLAAHPVTEVQFNDKGIELAVKGGYIQRLKGFSPIWQFTEKGLYHVGKRIAQNEINRGQFDMAVPNFKLKTPIGQKVRKITGIADAGMAGYKSVEYEKDYVFPSEMQPLKHCFFTGVNGLRITFQKFDDGWRALAPRQQ